MKRILFGSVALLGLVGAAHAADLPARYPVKAPPPVAPPSWDWSGFYLGAYWGNSINQSSATTPTAVTGSGPGTVNINDGGWTGGGTAGLNWQFAPSWLVGVEGDYGKLGGTRLFGQFNDVPGVTTGTKDSWYATARGRLGYVTGPTLIYVTGGAGWVHVTDTFGIATAPTQSATTTSGAAIGGGIEVKLSRNWTAKTEYIYIDGGAAHSFGSNSYAFTGTPTAFTHNFQVIKSGLNYRFDGPWDGLPFFADTMQATNHNWNGFYAGGNAGIGSSMIQGESTTQIHPGDNDLNGTGFNGGGTLGYNYMLADKYLLGVEGDFNALRINHSVTDWNDPGVVLTEKTSWFGTIRGRIGTSTGPALLYFTGGAAFVNFQDGALNTLGGAGLAGGGQSAGSVTTKTSAGWTFGGGTEVALDAHWSAKIESLFIDAGKSTRATFTVNTAPAPMQFKERFGIVRAGLNYAFN
jgi:outer membrane immunogenic protein